MHSLNLDLQRAHQLKSRRGHLLCDEAGRRQTTLEIAVKSDSFIKPGQPTIDVIYAIGDERSYTSTIAIGVNKLGAAISGAHQSSGNPRLIGP